MEAIVNISTVTITSNISTIYKITESIIGDLRTSTDKYDDFSKFEQVQAERLEFLKKVMPIAMPGDTYENIVAGLRHMVEH